MKSSTRFMMVKYAHGRVLVAAGDVEHAETALKEALAVAQQIGNAFFQIDIHLALAQLYRNLNREDDAGEHVGRVLQLSEEVAATIDDPAMRDAYLTAPPFATARSLMS
ncbi:MAG: hypothetical protein ACE5LU_12600 [Anaerolineae bacterium]